MIVGAAVIELHVHGSTSLKQKRGVVRSVVQRVRNRYNVSVAEVGGQDTWQRAVLGVSATGNEASGVRRALERVIEFIESLHLAEVRATDVELLDLPQGEDTLGGTDADTEGEPLPWEES